ncbi:MAG: M48 family metalloprotease [Deltaproteobacteria bacterium]|nr:M48 family metalloprotease [Deltaproteobacteria bacterium]
MNRLHAIAVATAMALGVAAVPGAAGCAGLGEESWIIPEEDEVALGQRFNQELLAQMPEFKGDPAVIQYVAQMGAAIAAVSDRPPNGVLQYRFTVVDSDEINAFAIPGGYVYVTKGLLKTARSGAEVASIVAHEIGHIAARHGVKQLETMMLAQGLGSLIGDEQIAELVSGAIQVGTGLTFSKDQEREADRLGVAYANAAGWNPWGMVDFFSFLLTLEPKEKGNDPLTGLGELFATHPDTAERVGSVQAQLGAMGIAREAAGLRWEAGTTLDQVKAAL